MAFHDVRFPEEISYGSKGGPQFNTTVVGLASGFEKRNKNWSQQRAKYDVAHGIKTVEQMTELRNFFYAREGRAHSFRFKDHGDFTIEDMIFATGDGATTVFQLAKIYESGGHTYRRQITKPVTGTLGTLYVDGVAKVEDTDFVVNYENGLITFIEAPEDTKDIAIDYIEFDVHCRFDTDHFDPVHEFWLTESWASIPLIEVKEKIT